MADHTAATASGAATNHRRSQGLSDGTQARLSVLTPSFNYGHYLRDALMSVRSQKGVSVEHVVQDACSMDGTPRVLDEFGTGVKWQAEPDAGQSDALNKALARAQGEWIGWLNADEFYLPDGLKVLVDAASHSNADVVYGDTLLVDAHGRLLKLVPQHRFHPFFLKWYGCFITSASVVFRREVLSETPWDVSMRLTMDWDLYLRLARAGARFQYVPYPVGAFRIHEEQVIARPTSEFGADFLSLKRRYNVRHPALRAGFGRWIHDVRKLMDGSYPRQLRSRAFQGRDLRWFSSEIAARDYAIFLWKCYGQ